MKLKSNQRVAGSCYNIALIEDDKVAVRAGRVGDKPITKYIPFDIEVGDNIVDCITYIYDAEHEQELLEEFLTKLEEYGNETKK